jgi:hypothetical protein
MEEMTHGGGRSAYGSRSTHGGGSIASGKLLCGVIRTGNHA